MNAKDIDGRQLATEILDGVAEDVARLKAAGWHPKLVSIMVGENPAAAFYIRNQRRKCERVGIAFEQREFSADITQEELHAAIWALNVDPRVTGILLQRPMPYGISIKQAQAAIDPLKDVEGMHPASIGNIVYRELDSGPATTWDRSNCYAARAYSTPSYGAGCSDLRNLGAGCCAGLD